jgi:D-glycero-D-manno-heptose 1,7-bisphosphate phosphatase
MIDKTWTLFLDRDGVINTRILGGYVHKWDQFEFIPGVLQALKILGDLFPRIVVVSNQQGIGKGLMSEQDLLMIHEKLIAEVKSNGGKIDRIYHSPSLESEQSVNRKPNVGMALMARKEFPEIRFKKSVMVGDSISDMVFGKKLKMKTAFLSDDLILARKHSRSIDLIFPDLLTFAESVKSSL